MLTYTFKRVPGEEDKWDVSHGPTAYDGRFNAHQARNFASQLRLEGHRIVGAPAEQSPVAAEPR